jgi:hypothetical protein
MATDMGAIIGALLEAEVPPYQDLCREERHFLAVLFALMNLDTEGLARFVARHLGGHEKVPIDETTRLFYEYSKPRDLWAWIDREPGSNRKRPMKARDDIKRAVVKAGLMAFGDADPALPSSVEAFNALFNEKPNSGQIMSPATWQMKGSAEGALFTAARLLKTAFKIKPDIVIETQGRPVVCIEAKLESREDRYDCGESQIGMQRKLFRCLLGADPVIILVSQRKGSGEADLALTWDEVFACFPKHAEAGWVLSAVRRLEILDTEKRPGPAIGKPSVPPMEDTVLPQQDRVGTMKNQFPSHAELQDRPEYYRLLLPFIEENGRKPNAVNATIGIPAGVAPGERNRPAGNSLYRIRTTKKYYNEASAKQENLPDDVLELELWDDIHAKLGAEFAAWLKAKEIALVSGCHNDQRQAHAWIARISKPLKAEDVRELNRFLRRGLELVYKA